jgi:aminopeptidase-like protein
LLKGKTEKEIFISSYICHPSLANNELSGPCLLTYLAKAIIENRTRYYSYRIILIPETIGAIAYISMHLSKMKENIVAGFNLTCVGDNRDYSFMPSRNGDTIIDRIAKHVLFHMYPEYKEYSYLQRGSDERQYCSSGVDLPVISMMRTKYAEYPEYHTSDDNLTVISPEGFDGSYKVHIAAINAIENNWYPKSNTLGEPQMGKRGLRPDRGVSNRISADSKLLLNLMAYADGKTSLFDIANIFGVPIWRLYEPINLLVSHQLLQLYDYPSD